MKSFKYVILVAVLVLSACGGASSGDTGEVLDALDRMAAESASVTGESGQAESESVSSEGEQPDVTDRGSRVGESDADTATDSEPEREVQAQAAGEGDDADEGDTDEGDADEAPTVVPTVPPEPTVVVLTGDETPEICPSVELVAAAAGLELDLVTGFIEETDSFGTDPESGVTSCNYQGADSSFISLSFRESPVDTTWILDGSIEGIQPTELDAGAIQVQFEGQPDSCEIYDGQTSVVVFTGSASVDVCGAALAVVALG